VFTTVLLVAAGRSRGRQVPRALRRSKGATRLETAVENALASVADEVVVVLGRRVAQARAILEPRPRLRVVTDPLHTEKLSALLSTGIRASSPEATAYFVAYGDDRAPRTGEVNGFLNSAAREGKPITVRGDRTRSEVLPILFERSLRNEILRESGDEGLRRLVEGDPTRLGLVRLERGAARVPARKASPSRARRKRGT
jgi:CTP:molybdopterin cytidylyltransferase MocA